MGLFRCRSSATKERDSMKEFDYSIKDEYYSQLNNKFVPHEACVPTSFIMALIYNKINVIQAGTDNIKAPSFVYPKGVQPEDFLLSVCRSPWGYSLRDSMANWAVKDDVPPNQVHSVISFITNSMVGKNITEFLFGKQIEDLIAELRSGHPVVVTGKFTESGHAVVVCGYRETAGSGVTHLLIDDPYGNYFTEYKDKEGNNIWFPIMKFIELWPRWYHRFRDAGV